MNFLSKIIHKTAFIETYYYKIIGVLLFTCALWTTKVIAMSPIIAAEPTDGLNYLYELSPLIYTIVIGLLIAITALSLTVRVLWKKNMDLTKDKDEIQESKLKIAMSSTETIREAITLVQNIHDKVSKLNENETDRRISDQEIRGHLSNIEKDINEIRKEIQKGTS